VWERANRILKNEKPGVHILGALAKWKELGVAEETSKGLTAFWIDEAVARQYCSQNLELQKKKIMRMNAVEEEELWKSCVKDEQADIIVRTNERDVKWTCPVWVIPKKSEGAGNPTFRRVRDCRRLNELLEDIPFEMENTTSIMDLARPNLYATSLDLKSAYNLLPIDYDSEAKGLHNPENFAYYNCFR
jgi:hypothetical protein